MNKTTTTTEEFTMGFGWEEAEFKMEKRTARCLRRIERLANCFATNGAVIRNASKIADVFNEKSESYIRPMFTVMDETSAWYHVEYSDSAGEGTLRFLMP